VSVIRRLDPVLTDSGPINTLAVHPTGKAYASGAEDGFVRVHWVSVKTGYE